MLVRMWRLFQNGMYFWAHFRSSGKFSRGKDRQKLTTSETQGTGLKESTSNYVFNIEFVLKWMIYTLYVIGIFIINCSLSNKGFINAKINPLSSVKSKTSCNNLIFSVDFFICHYQQHLQSALLNTETGSYPHFLTAKWSDFISSWMRWYGLLNYETIYSCPAVWYSDDWDGQ